MSRRVAIAIPTLNEAAHIGSLLRQFAAQPGDRVVDIIVADGGSTDGTRDIVREAGRNDPRIRLVDNPGRFQSAGINRALEAADARADTIVRIDAHARYPDDYVERILDAFQASGAEMVATRLRTVGKTCLQRGIAAASNSRLGTGGSAHRIGGRSGFVDHGHHAGIDRAFFERVRGYDESFFTNEDAELDYRLRRAGARIWLAADVEVEYAPRTSLGALIRQYWRYGRGRARTFLKHRERLRLRQLLPPALSVALCLSLVLALFDPLFLVLPVAYVVAVAVGAVAVAFRLRSRCALMAAPAAIIMHVVWGLGFVATLLSPRRGGGTKTGGSVLPAPLLPGLERE